MLGFLLIWGCSEHVNISETLIDTVIVKDTIFDTLRQDTLIIRDTLYIPYVDKTYYGSQACQSCHAEIYQKFIESGHPYILNKITGDAAPSYPSFIPPPQLPAAYTSWNQLEYVIGGYMQKAEFFLDNTGHIYGENADPLGYICGECHTTGYNPAGVRSDTLIGIAGTWCEPGVGCEACHKAGGQHVASGGLEEAFIDRSPDFCAGCHASVVDSTIAAYCACDSGYTMHHELMAGKKAIMNCVDCHDPHASTRYDADAAGEGIHASCENCHQPETKSYQTSSHNTDSTGVICIDCHMPRVSGSARTHIFYITTDPLDNQFKDDLTTNPYIALDYACLTCHGSDTGLAQLTGMNRAWAAANAPTVHGQPSDTAFDYVAITDFDLDLIQGDIPSFRQLTGKKLFLFYASTTCPHCQAAAPAVVEFAKSLDSLGVTSVVVFTGSSTLESIESFIITYNIALPVFQDAQYEFFTQYGQIYVPMFIAAKANGEWLRNIGYSEEIWAEYTPQFLEFLQ